MMGRQLSKRAETLVLVARQAIDAGMKVLATAEGSKIPDKRFCPHGLKDATASLRQVEMWLRTDDQINLAASLQGSGICAVDVDGRAGETSLKAITTLGRTRKTRTRNGSHRFYRYEGDLGGSVIKLAPDLDFIMSGYVMLPGSRHPDGGVYRSVDFSAPIADMPIELIEAIRSHRKGVRSPQTETKQSTVAKGQRDNSLTSIAGAIRRQGHGQDVILSALRAVNERHCRPPLSDSAVQRISKSISRYAPEHENLFGLMADVTPRQVKFLWEPYFVRGAVNLLEGDPNVGKTYCLCHIAAAISSGMPLPGQSDARPQNVLFMSAEDDPETTLVRRLMRMGADLNRVWFITKFVRLEEDVFQHIERHIDEKKVRLVIIDPLLAYMQGGIDMNKANETRPFMARLAELAKAKGVTIIALRHLNKAEKDKAIFRGLGSIDITAAARSAVMIGLHPEDASKRVFAHIKHNLSERGSSLLYELRGTRKAGEVPKLVWKGETELTAEDLARQPGRPGRPDTASQDAAAFLRNALASGPRPIKDVVRDAERRAIAYRTLRKVRRDIGVVKDGRSWKLAETGS
jgi:hypothetical protein